MSNINWNSPQIINQDLLDIPITNGQILGITKLDSIPRYKSIQDTDLIIDDSNSILNINIERYGIKTRINFELENINNLVDYIKLDILRYNPITVNLDNYNSFSIKKNDILLNSFIVIFLENGDYKFKYSTMSNQNIIIGNENEYPLIDFYKVENSITNDEIIIIEYDSNNNLVIDGQNITEYIIEFNKTYTILLNSIDKILLLSLSSDLDINTLDQLYPGKYYSKDNNNYLELITSEVFNLDQNLNNINNKFTFSTNNQEQIIYLFYLDLNDSSIVSLNSILKITSISNNDNNVINYNNNITYPQSVKDGYIRETDIVNISNLKVLNTISGRYIADGSLLTNIPGPEGTIYDITSNNGILCNPININDIGFVQLDDSVIKTSNDFYQKINNNITVENLTLSGTLNITSDFYSETNFNINTDIDLNNNNLLNLNVDNVTDNSGINKKYLIDEIRDTYNYIFNKVQFDNNGNLISNLDCNNKKIINFSSSLINDSVLNKTFIDNNSLNITPSSGLEFDVINSVFNVKLNPNFSGIDISSGVIINNDFRLNNTKLNDFYSYTLPNPNYTGISNNYIIFQTDDISNKISDISNGLYEDEGEDKVMIYSDTANKIWRNVSNNMEIKHCIGSNFSLNIFTNSVFINSREYLGNHVPIINLGKDRLYTFDINININLKIIDNTNTEILLNNSRYFIQEAGSLSCQLSTFYLEKITNNKIPFINLYDSSDTLRLKIKIEDYCSRNIINSGLSINNNVIKLDNNIFDSVGDNKANIICDFSNSDNLVYSFEINWRGDLEPEPEFEPIEPEPEEEPELELEFEPEYEPELENEPETELELEPEFEPNFLEPEPTEPELELEPTEPEPETEPVEPEPEEEPELEPEPEPETEPELELEPEFEPEPELEPEMEFEPETELELETELEFEPESIEENNYVFGYNSIENITSDKYTRWNMISSNITLYNNKLIMLPTRDIDFNPPFFQDNYSLLILDMLYHEIIEHLDNNGIFNNNQWYIEPNYNNNYKLTSNFVFSFKLNINFNSDDYGDNSTKNLLLYNKIIQGTNIDTPFGITLTHNLINRNFSIRSLDIDPNQNLDSNGNKNKFIVNLNNLPENYNNYFYIDSFVVINYTEDSNNYSLKANIVSLSFNTNNNLEITINKSLNASSKQTNIFINAYRSIHTLKLYLKNINSNIGGQFLGTINSNYVEIIKNLNEKTLKLGDNAFSIMFSQSIGIFILINDVLVLNTNYIFNNQSGVYKLYVGYDPIMPSIKLNSDYKIDNLTLIYSDIDIGQLLSLNLNITSNLVSIYNSYRFLEGISIENDINNLYSIDINNYFNESTNNIIIESIFKKSSVRNTSSISVKNTIYNNKTVSNINLLISILSVENNRFSNKNISLNDGSYIYLLDDFSLLDNYLDVNAVYNNLFSMESLMLCYYDFINLIDKVNGNILSNNNNEVNIITNQNYNKTLYFSQIHNNFIQTNIINKSQNSITENPSFMTMEIDFILNTNSLTFINNPASDNGLCLFTLKSEKNTSNGIIFGEISLFIYLNVIKVTLKNIYQDINLNNTDNTNTHFFYYDSDFDDGENKKLILKLNYPYTSEIDSYKSIDSSNYVLLDNNLSVIVNDNKLKHYGICNNYFTLHKNYKLILGSYQSFNNNISNQFLGYINKLIIYQGSLDSIYMLNNSNNIDVEQNIKINNILNKDSFVSKKLLSNYFRWFFNSNNVNINNYIFNPLENLLFTQNQNLNYIFSNLGYYNYNRIDEFINNIDNIFLLNETLEAINTSPNSDNHILYNNSIVLDIDKIQSFYINSTSYYYLYSYPNNSLDTKNWSLNIEDFFNLNTYSNNNLKNYYFGNINNIKGGRNFKRNGMLNTFIFSEIGGEFNFKFKPFLFTKTNNEYYEYFVGLSHNSTIFENGNIENFVTPEKHNLIFYWKFYVSGSSITCAPCVNLNIIDLLDTQYKINIEVPNDINTYEPEYGDSNLIDISNLDFENTIFSVEFSNDNNFNTINWYIVGNQKIRYLKINFLVDNMEEEYLYSNIFNTKSLSLFNQDRELITNLNSKRIELTYNSENEAEILFSLNKHYLENNYKLVRVNGVDFIDDGTHGFTINNPNNDFYTFNLVFSDDSNQLLNYKKINGNTYLVDDTDAIIYTVTFDSNEDQYLNTTVKLFDQYGSEYHYLSNSTETNLINLGLNKYSFFYPITVFKSINIPNNVFNDNNGTLGIYNFNIGYSILHNDYSQSNFNKFIDTVSISNDLFMVKNSFSNNYQIEFKKHISYKSSINTDFDNNFMDSFNNTYISDNNLIYKYNSNTELENIINIESINYLSLNESSSKKIIISNNKIKGIINSNKFNNFSLSRFNNTTTQQVRISNDKKYLYILQYYWTDFDTDIKNLYYSKYNVNINQNFNVFYKLLKYNLTTLTLESNFITSDRYLNNNLDYLKKNQNLNFDWNSIIQLNEVKNNLDISKKYSTITISDILLSSISNVILFSDTINPDLYLDVLYNNLINNNNILKHNNFITNIDNKGEYFTSYKNNMFTFIADVDFTDSKFNNFISSDVYNFKINNIFEISTMVIDNKIYTFCYLIIISNESITNYPQFYKIIVFEGDYDNYAINNTNNINKNIIVNGGSTYCEINLSNLNSYINNKGKLIQISFNLEESEILQESIIKNIIRSYLLKLNNKDYILKNYYYDFLEDNNNNIYTIGYQHKKTLFHEGYDTIDKYIILQKYNEYLELIWELEIKDINVDDILNIELSILINKIQILIVYETTIQTIYIDFNKNILNNQIISKDINFINTDIFGKDISLYGYDNNLIKFKLINSYNYQILKTSLYEIQNISNINKFTTSKINFINIASVTENNTSIYELSNNNFNVSSVINNYTLSKKIYNLNNLITSLSINDDFYFLDVQNFNNSFTYQDEAIKSIIFKQNINEIKVSDNYIFARSNNDILIINSDNETDLIQTNNCNRIKCTDYYLLYSEINISTGYINKLVLIKRDTTKNSWLSGSKQILNINENYNVLDFDLNTKYVYISYVYDNESKLNIYPINNIIYFPEININSIQKGITIINDGIDYFGIELKTNSNNLLIKNIFNQTLTNSFSFQIYDSSLRNIGFENRSNYGRLFDISNNMIVIYDESVGDNKIYLYNRFLNWNLSQIISVNQTLEKLFVNDYYLQNRDVSNIFSGRSSNRINFHINEKSYDKEIINIVNTSKISDNNIFSSELKLSEILEYSNLSLVNNDISKYSKGIRSNLINTNLLINGVQRSKKVIESMSFRLENSNQIINTSNEFYGFKIFRYNNVSESWVPLGENISTPLNLSDHHKLLGFIEDITVSNNDIILLKYMSSIQNVTSVNVNYINYSGRFLRNNIENTLVRYTYTKISNIDKFKACDYWEKINYFEIYELDNNDSFILESKRVFKSNNYSDSNYIHSRIIKLDNNKKYGFVVCLQCYDKNVRKINMCFNYLNSKDYKNYTNNNNHPYGNNLNYINDWEIKSDDRNNNSPNIVNIFNKGCNIWKFKLNFNNLESGNYIFGFSVLFGNFNLKKQNSILFGSRILYTLHISNNIINNSLLYSREYNDNTNIENKEIITNLRNKYLNLYLNYNQNLEELNKKFYDKLKNITILN